MTKEIRIDAGSKLTQDAAGKWRLIDTDCGLNEPLLESDVIDVLTRRSRKHPHLKAAIREHFPMHGFHS